MTNHEWAWIIDETIKDIRLDIWKHNDRRGYFAPSFDGSDDAYNRRMRQSSKELRQWEAKRRHHHETRLGDPGFTAFYERMAAAPTTAP